MPQWVVIARDGRDAEALARRMAARPAHFARLPGMMERGELHVGGAMLGDDGGMVGSVAIVEFPDRAALDAWLAEEPYMTGDVWRDVEVIPFRTAVPATMTPRG
jgi:uncharacterized protein YciI